MADINLSKGDPTIGMSATPKRPPGMGSVTAEAARQKAETALRNDLEGVFGRISDLFAARDDQELAQAFGEDAKVLATGLVSLTSSVKPLRSPLVLAVHLVEPLLAFGRILGILARRIRDRRFVEMEEPAVG